MSETATEASTTEPTGVTETTEGEGQAFTQADVDRIVRERVQRERAKYADYDDLKAKAGTSSSLEEQVTTLRGEVEASKREAMKRRVQAAHGISDEDADLFLTGADEDALTAQATRLAAREADRKKNSNRVPREGNNPAPKANDEREFVRNLFGSGG